MIFFEQLLQQLIHYLELPAVLQSVLSELNFLLRVNALK